MQLDSGRGLYLPETHPEPLSLFLDEAHLFRQTATVQSAVLVPTDWYVREGREAAAGLLRQLDRTAKEFKASSLTRGTFWIYEKFLDLFVRATASVSGTGLASSVVSVDGPSFHPKDYVADLARRLDAAFAEYGASIDPRFLSEFSRQLAWFGRHGERLIKTPIQNGLTITFDNKYSYPRAC